MSSVEVELKEIRSIIEDLNRKVDRLISNMELLSIMAISERSLKELLSEEPDIYTVKDLKVSYR